MATDYSDDQRPSPTDEVREYDVPAKRTFVFTITTDYPDGEQAARDAAHKAVEQIGWGDDNTSSFELVEIHDDGTASYLAGWEFEPGEQSGGPILYDADTAEPIGPATPEQIKASNAATEKDGGAGIIRIDRTTGELSETGRRVYTDPA